MTWVKLTERNVTVKWTGKEIAAVLLQNALIVSTRNDINTMILSSAVSQRIIFCRFSFDVSITLSFPSSCSDSWSSVRASENNRAWLFHQCFVGEWLQRQRVGVSTHTITTPHRPSALLVDRVFRRHKRRFGLVSEMFWAQTSKVD